MNLDPDPSSSDSSDSSSSDSAPKKKKIKKNKKRRKHRKDDSSEPSSNDDPDSSEDSHYRRKQRKDKKHRKKDPIRLCATLTAKLLTTAYKSKIIRFKLDEDPLQRRIYFLTFIDSLDMIFSQYRCSDLSWKLARRLRSPPSLLPNRQKRYPHNITENISLSYFLYLMYL